MSETKEWWTAIRQTAFFAAAEQSEPEPEPVDPAAIELAEWGARRGELGLGGYDSDFIGIDNGGGLPDWRTPVVEEVQFSAMDKYAAQRKELGVRDASAEFGASPAQPRVNRSSWSVV